MFRRNDDNREISSSRFTTVSRYRKIVFGLLLAIAVTMAATVMIIPRLLDLNNYRSRILALAQDSLNRKVSYESASFSWQFGPAFSFSKLVIKEKNGETSLLEADRLTFSLALLPLLHHEVRLRNLLLERPRLRIDRDAAGTANIADLFVGKPGGPTIHLNALKISNGRVSFTDRFGNAETTSVDLEDLDLSVHNPNRGETAEIKLTSSLAAYSSRAKVTISGTAAIPAVDKPLSTTALDLAITAKNLEMNRYWPFYGRYLPVAGLSGELELDGKFRGTIREFTSSGNLRCKRLQLNYPTVFPAPLSSENVTLSYRMELTSQNLSVQAIDLSVDGLRIKGNCSVSDIRSADPHISADASTSSFRFEQCNKYIPYGIIPDSTAAFIQQQISAGNFRLDEVRLNGRLSNLRRMGQGDNHKALLVRGRVDQGVMTMGADIPTISSISGTLELTGKDFVLQGMAGRFGSSPFTLDGKIADFSLDRPTSYPFTMTMTPAQPEVAWLLRQKRLDEASFAGQSRLSLSGAGTADKYQISGLWDLSTADYRYQQLLHKPAGRPNRLSFNAYLDRETVSVSDVRYELGDLRVTANATYHHADQEHPLLTFAATTSQFAIKPNLSVFPVLQQYQPGGILQATISGSGNPATADKLVVQGAVTLTNVSIRPSAQLQQLSEIGGTIHFTGTALETAQLSGKLGSSPLTIAGRLDGFTKPDIDLDISSQGLHLQDLGFHSSGEDLIVESLAGSLSLRNDNLALTALSGEILQSKFSITGEVLDITKPRISLNVLFPVLRIEDLLPLTRLTHGDKTSGQASVETLTAQISVGKGSVRNLSFENFKTDLTLERNRLAVHSASVGIFGGSVRGSGHADFSGNGEPRYDARYQLEQVKAKDFLQSADLQQMTTGLLSGEGEVSARGETLDDLKASATVSTKLRLEDGRLDLQADAAQKNGSGFPFAKIESDLSYSGKMLALQSVRIAAFDGMITGTGSIDLHDPEAPYYQITARIENLDAGPFFQTAGVPQVHTGRLTLTLGLSARGGTLDELQSSARGSADLTLSDGIILLPTDSQQLHAGRFLFKTIKSRLSIDRQVLTMESARIDAFGGVMTGSGAADFTVPRKPAYQFRLQMAEIDAASFLQAVGMAHELSGSLALRSDLSATGESTAELKKTLQGPVELHFKRGVIYKLPLISKLFTLLNVSQLFDFRLPDLMGEGMPYDMIDGNFTFLDGSIATSDLTVQSQSLNMTLVGKADLVKEDIDATIGVQPLQAVGRIISRVPVIGWLLTGKSRDVLVVYYTAKGPWANPTVTSTSTAALSKGVVDIFKRIYNLPEELISEPGRVILGN